MEATVTKLKKNKTSEVWVCLRDYQGKQYVDVREHFLLAEERKWKPTAKGIMPVLCTTEFHGSTSDFWAWRRR